MKGKNTRSSGKTLGVAPLLGIQSTLFDYLFTYFCASPRSCCPVFQRPGFIASQCGCWLTVLSVASLSC